jgi:hypothetical protein
MIYDREDLIIDTNDDWKTLPLGPATETFTNNLHEKTKAIQNYWIADLPDVSWKWGVVVICDFTSNSGGVV